ncbi:hypothetical protein HXX76_012604 [Chlamydomonas incerta]|uniref:Uncharacterized protein n=1 Tax=Chlamydomonas incerta TaxID=51695 RepID=A0A835VV78_CHLIN|nr:hypothetical protein HXX76_012604 [Chlamydomonas incerta]|eukprot:KAG2427093.1 hypothetical protein HXX76_012604 [Chlamydomonas incerta]
MAPSRDDLSQSKASCLVAPRPRKGSACSAGSTSGRQVEASQPEQASQRSRLTSSLQAMETGGEQLGELELILQGQPPDVPNNFLGVSPPVRSGCYGGAANPMQHDSSWTSCSLSASSSNLQALRELDSQHSFLRSLNGDYRLLLAPDARGFASSEDVGARPAAPAPPQERTHLLPFTCRAQYFAVR